MSIWDTIKSFWNKDVGDKIQSTAGSLAGDTSKSSSGLLNFVGNAAGWVYDNVVPQSVKDKLKAQFPAGVSFVGMVSLVFSWFLNLYFYMTIAAIIVVYRLFMALKKAGILDAFTKILEDKMGSVFNISAHCFSEIPNLKALWACINRY